MTTIRFFLRFCLLLALPGLGGGCATLPNVSHLIGTVPADPPCPQIVCAKGLVSSKESRAILDRLERSGEPTDVLGRQIAVTEAVSQSDLIQGNKIALLIDGPATYAAMYQAIRDARDHVNLETFVVEEMDDAMGHRFAEVLMEKQAQGVQVNLLYDAVGSHNTPAAFFQRLRGAGIAVVEFNPIDPMKAHGKWDLMHRDHRKLLVVDGRIAITGGLNVRQGYVHSPSSRRKEKRSSIPWRDTDVQIEGPAVAEFQRLFLDTWRQQKGPALSGRDYFPALQEEGNTPLLVINNTPGQFNRTTFITYVSAITFANRSVYVTNAYFVPDRQILDALTTAAQRGVDVRIVLPSVTDQPLVLSAQRYTYSRLLKAGVQLYERRHALLHAKTAVIDGVWSTVGSSNLDLWSLLRDNELNAVILDRPFAADMEKLFALDLAQSDQIQWETWKRRPLGSRIQEYVAHLFAHWL